MKIFSIRPITKVKCKGNGGLQDKCPNFENEINLQNVLGENADFCNHKGCQGDVEKEREWNYSAIAVYTIVLLVIASGIWILLRPKIIPVPIPTPTPSFGETPTPTPIPKAEKISSIAVPTLVNSLGITNNGETVITGGEDGNIYLWDTKTGQMESTFSEHTQPVMALAVSPDQLTIASSSKDKTIKVWDLQTKKVLVTIPEPNVIVTSLAISDDGQTLVGGGLGNLIFVWDTQTGKLKHSALTVPKESGVYSLAISGDAQSIVSGNANGIISKWKKNSDGRYEESTRFNVTDGVQRTSVVVSSDGNNIFTSNCGKMVTKWDGNLAKVEPPLQSDLGIDICSIVLSKDGRILIMGSSKG